MPLTVRKFNAQVKDPQSGQMVPAGLLSSDSLQAIEAAESAAITEIQQKGRQTRESIPDDYTELSDSVDELKTQLYSIENSNPSDWQQGWWGASSGAYDSAHNNAVCTKNVIPDTVKKILCSSSYKMRFQAWEASTYKGIWNGAAFTTVNPNYFMTEIDVLYFTSEYPTYTFKIVLYSSDGTSDITTSEATNVILYLSRISLLENDVSDINHSFDSLKKYIGSIYEGSVITDLSPQFLCRFPCIVNTGDEVTISTTYTGSNAATYDIRFCDSHGNIHIIETSQPIGTDYTFTSEGDYVEASLYKQLSAAEDGKVFSASIYVSGSLINDVNTLKGDVTEINTEISSIESDIEQIKNSGDSSEANFYNGITLISGRVYNGVYSDAITTTHCTDYISLLPGHIYAVYGGYTDANYTNYYDANKIYKGSLPLTELKNTYPYDQSNNHLVFTAPADAYFTRINFLNAGLVDGDKVQPYWYFRDITFSVWAQKKILVIGDSISTDVYGGYKKWVTDFIDEGYFTKGLTTNDSYHATGFVATYNGQASTTFINRIQTHDADDFDAMILFGGINDYIQSIDFDTFKTAVDTFFAYVTSNYYKGRIAIMLPLRTATTTANSAGKYQQDYSDYIKEVAESYCLPVLNLTKDSGFYPFVEVFKNQWTLLPEGYTAHDGVHPTEEWEKNFLCPMVKKFLNGLY